MKYKCTRKDLKARYTFVLCVGYCDLQYLLNYESAVAYNSGVYGWNYDIFELEDPRGFGRCAICTGYRPIGDKVNHDIIREYDQKAEKILSWENKATYEEKRLTLQELIKDFLKKAIES